MPLPDKPSIAVLPFANMSGDPEQEYFADGMVEEIIPNGDRLQECPENSSISKAFGRGLRGDDRNSARNGVSKIVPSPAYGGSRLGKLQPKRF